MPTSSTAGANILIWAAQQRPLRRAYSVPCLYVRVCVCVCLSRASQVESFGPATHAYSFWEGIPVSARCAFGKLFTDSSHMKVCVASRPLYTHEIMFDKARAHTLMQYRRGLRRLATRDTRTRMCVLCPYMHMPKTRMMQSTCADDCASRCVCVCVYLYL